MGFFERLKGMSDDSRERRRQADIESRGLAEEYRNHLRQQELDDKRQWKESLALGHETFERLEVVKKMTELQRTAQRVFGKGPAPEYLDSSHSSKSIEARDIGRMLTDGGDIWIDVHAGRTTYISYRDGSDYGRSEEKPRIQVRVIYTVKDRELRINKDYCESEVAHKPARDWTVEEFDRVLLEQWPH